MLLHLLKPNFWQLVLCCSCCCYKTFISQCRQLICWKYFLFVLCLCIVFPSLNLFKCFMRKIYYFMTAWWSERQVLRFMGSWRKFLHIKLNFPILFDIFMLFSITKCVQMACICFLENIWGKFHGKIFFLGEIITIYEWIIKN